MREGERSEANQLKGNEPEERSEEQRYLTTR